eukprot:666239-Prymnesium_polylepis.1
MSVSATRKSPRCAQGAASISAADARPPSCPSRLGEEDSQSTHSSGHRSRITRTRASLQSSQYLHGGQRNR